MPASAHFAGGARHGPRRAADGQIPPQELLAGGGQALLRLQAAARHEGAAAGPLAAGACLAFIGPEIMHIFVALGFIFALTIFVRSSGWRLITQPA